MLKIDLSKNLSDPTAKISHVIVVFTDDSGRFYWREIVCFTAVQ